jgi:hypothetical protein
MNFFHTEQQISTGARRVAGKPARGQVATPRSRAPATKGAGASSSDFERF